MSLFFFQHNKPLYSFEDNADYVYDVMWSPVHPAIFAAVDGMGRLDLWNLNNDTEVCEYRSLGACVLMCMCVWCPQSPLLGSLRLFPPTSGPSTTKASTSLPTRTQIQDSLVGVSHSARSKSDSVTSPHPGSRPG